MDQAVDSKAFSVTFLLKIPYLILWGLVGAILGSGLYLLVMVCHNQNKTYFGKQMYYIEFSYDWSKDYYNDFTWNDLMSTDLILGKAMEDIAGASREEVASLVTARIYSDVRYLTVEFKGNDKDLLENVSNAFEKAIVAYPERVDELTSITCIEKADILEQITKVFTINAVIIGFITAVIIYIIVFSWKFCLLDRIYTLRDIEVILNITGLSIEEAKKYEELDINASLLEMDSHKAKKVVLKLHQGLPCVRNAYELIKHAKEKDIEIVGAYVADCSRLWLKLYGIKNIDGVYGVK